MEAINLVMHTLSVYISLSRASFLLLMNHWTEICIYMDIYGYIYIYIYICIRTKLEKKN